MPQQNAGKDEYTVDLEGNEKLYWLGTESGLIGGFGFVGACTEGDDSCDPPTRSMGTGFCNFRVLRWNTDTPLAQPLLQEQSTRDSRKVSREEEGLSSNRPELMALSKSPDTDILKDIIFKLQKRVEAGVATLLIKVKDHRGDPLNGEADIRAELGRRKEYKETIWDDLSGRTVYHGPISRGQLRFLRPRSGLTLCAITLDRRQGK